MSDNEVDEFPNDIVLNKLFTDLDRKSSRSSLEFESDVLEYKREYTDDIKRTVIAFANTIGGKIIIGVNDDLSVLGVSDSDKVILQITSSINDTIKPDLSMFVKYSTILIEDKYIVVVDIQKGTACPYYLGKKGIRPEGVFVRRGTATLPATQTAILNMIKETSGDNYETIRSLEQNLTFKYCYDEFDKSKIKLEKEQMRTLNFTNIDGEFSNLAFLLSDQCIHTIKIAIFQGDSKQIFKDRYEFKGSLFKQMRECVSFIDRYNSTRSQIIGIDRMDYRDYPQVAIREALLNALVHRDYSFNSSTLISIFDDRMEFVTIGGLLRGITKDDILLGVSMLRNKNLADVFYRLKLIEAYGTGVIKIIESYDKFSVTPEIKTTDNAFKITLFNTNYYNSTNDIKNISKKSSISEQKIIDFNSNKDIQNFILKLGNSM